MGWIMAGGLNLMAFDPFDYEVVAGRVGFIGGGYI
jgi:hypothetical protein